MDAVLLWYRQYGHAEIETAGSVDDAVLQAWRMIEFGPASPWAIQIFHHSGEVRVIEGDELEALIEAVGKRHEVDLAPADEPAPERTHQTWVKTPDGTWMARHYAAAADANFSADAAWARLHRDYPGVPDTHLAVTEAGEKP